MKTFFSTLVGACLGLALTGLVPAQAAVDADAAQASLKKSDCLKCHALDKTKVGPAFKDIAKKYAGQADAQDRLTTHITGNPVITIDGAKEEHRPLKSKDAAEIRNVVQWILSTAPAAGAEAAKPAAAAASAPRADGSCTAVATEKKLAGPARKSFLSKCKKEAAASCDKAAAEKNLVGAANKSFTKKCMKDAVGA